MGGRDWLRVLTAAVLLSSQIGLGPCTPVTAVPPAPKPQPREGALLTVFIGDQAILTQRCDVSHNKYIVKSDSGLGTLFAQVKRLEGDCALVTFRCGENEPEGPEIKICLGGPPVPTGCKAANGKPFNVQLTDIYQEKGK